MSKGDKVGTAQRHMHASLPLGMPFRVPSTTLSATRAVVRTILLLPPMPAGVVGCVAWEVCNGPWVGCSEWFYCRICNWVIGNV